MRLYGCSTQILGTWILWLSKLRSAQFMFRRTQRHQQIIIAPFHQRLMMIDKDNPTKEDGCCTGRAAGWAVAAAELCGAIGGATAGGAARSVRILRSSSAAIHSLMSLSCSTDADWGKTRWVSAWGQFDGLDNGQMSEKLMMTTVLTMGITRKPFIAESVFNLMFSWIFPI